MPIPYTHDLAKMANGGLELNLPPDLVPPTKYAILTNAVSRVEGQLQTREGTSLVCNVGALPVHTIFRLNQFQPAINGERLFGSGPYLYSAPLPAGNVITHLFGGFVFDGGPLAIFPFRFDGDPQIWAIIANNGGMMKRKGSYYQQLGLPAPTTVISASAGGAGLLTGTYDWRYTYVNSVNLSESNPSPAQSTASPSTVLPTSFLNPDPTNGGSPFANPANAYNGNPAGATGTSPGGSSPSTASCTWNGFSNAGTPYSSVTLFVDSNATTSTLVGAQASVGVEYSTDAGTTWNTLYLFVATIIAARGRKIDQATLDPGTDLSQLWVRVTDFSEANAVAGSTVYNISVTTIPTTGGSTGLVLATQSAILCVKAPTDTQEDHIRLYRRGGSLTDNWYFVSEGVVSALVQGVCGAGTLEIDDNAPDTQISVGPTLNLDNDMPVTSVRNVNQPLGVIWGYDERVLGCGDPARPEAVYFSKRGNADQWPPGNWLDVAPHGDQCMNGIVYSLRCFVFSRTRMTMLLPNIIQGATFTPAETSCRRGLKGRFGLCAGERGIYFWSNDGIYRTQGGPEESIIDDSIRPLFPTLESTVGVAVGSYDAIDMNDEDGLRMAYHNGEIWCDYTGIGGSRHRLIYDERRSRWRGATYSPQMQMAYSEPGTDSQLLQGGTDGDVYLAGNSNVDVDGSIVVQVRTGSFDQGVPLNLKEYANVAVDIDPGGATTLKPVTITPYLNNNAIPEAAIVVTGSGRQRVPLPLGDLYALNLSLLFQWTNDGTVNPILYQTDIEYRREPSSQKHWEIPPTSLGMKGWAHIRDCYITLRSQTTVTLTVTTDTYPAQTFTIPSTAGVKKKVYVPMGANKFKVVQIALDSAAEFRLYAEDSEVRVKQWVTKLGYQTIPLVGAEQVGTPMPFAQQV